MTIKITIIGTGQIGASIGLALAARKEQFLRVGHDKDLKIANRAKDLGAVDRVDFNLPSSVEDAAIIILAIPQDQIHETLGYIATELKENAILMDTAPLKAEIIQWTRDLLPPQRYYIGLAPVVNPAYLGASGSGVEAAHADLFQNGLMAICLPPDLPGEAIKLATDFSAMLGAEHMFIDPLELDSMMAAIQILPQLLAAAYLNSTVDAPGWQDVRKMTGRPFARLADAMGDSSDMGSLAGQAVSTRESLVRRIDLILDHLEQLRQQLTSGDVEKMKLDLEHASQGRESWLKERKTANWAVREMGSHVELPTSKQVFTRMFTFGGGRKPKPPK